MSKKSENIKVSVRCRPMNEKERKEGYQNCVHVDSERGEVQVNLQNQPQRNFFTTKFMVQPQHKTSYFKKQPNQ